MINIGAPQCRHTNVDREAELRERFARFGLELHPEKTRLIEFGRYARQNRSGRGDGGAPQTFNFLGFTHSCGKTRKGGFTVLRQTMRTRWQAKLRAVTAELRSRMHEPIPTVGAAARARALAPAHSHLPPLSPRAPGRPHPRWEPDAVITARPDLWRRCSAMGIPTPTGRRGIELVDGARGLWCPRSESNRHAFKGGGF